MSNYYSIKRLSIWILILAVSWYGLFSFHVKEGMDLQTHFVFSITQFMRWILILMMSYLSISTVLIFLSAVVPSTGKYISRLIPALLLTALTTTGISSQAFAESNERAPVLIPLVTTTTSLYDTLPGPVSTMSLTTTTSVPAESTTTTTVKEMQSQEPDESIHQVAKPDETWIVKSGESFWSIAESHVRANNSTATLSEIASYWLKLIDSNRDRLKEPTNPDLLFVGQELVLP